MEVILARETDEINAFISQKYLIKVKYWSRRARPGRDRPYAARVCGVVFG
ncbi:hypothetical protein [Burkholderia cenocepacia]|nr:hypothetical protein [Burkholderia cenocepacia]